MKLKRSFHGRSNHRKGNQRYPFAAMLSKNDDLLHHIIGFFISPTRGIVDGDSLLALSLTCHRLKDAVYSPSLWKQFNNHSESRDLIRTALSIQDHNDASSSIPKSLIGFVRRRTHSLPGNRHRLWFDVVERAHAIPCLLAVSKSLTIQPSMIMELYEGHAALTVDFLKPVTENENTSASTASSHFPQGIAVVNNRIVRWYHGDYEEYKSNLETFRISDQKFDSVSNLLQLEQSYTPPHERPRLRMDHWAALVDWIIEIIECFDLEDDVAFRAMSFMDRFLSFTPGQTLRRSQYQLVAGSALFLASQCGRSRKSTPLTIDDISFCTDNSYDREQIQSTSHYMLQTLKFRLAYPTNLDFIRAYTQHMQSKDLDWVDPSNRCYWMIRQIAELALQTPLYLSYSPSKIAACAVVLGRYCVRDNVVGSIWPESLEHVTGYSLADLKPCFQELIDRLQEIRLQAPNLTMIPRRYRSDSRGNVADIPIPPLVNFDLITNFEPVHPAV